MKRTQSLGKIMATLMTKTTRSRISEALQRNYRFSSTIWKLATHAVHAAGLECLDRFITAHDSAVASNTAGGTASGEETYG
jgi:hypothetical protein